MKRFYLLALLSLFQMRGVIYAQQSITDVSQLSNNKIYTVATATRGVWTTNTDGTAMTSTSAGAGKFAADNNKWAFLTIDGGIYAYNVGAKKFLKANAQLVQRLTQPLTITYRTKDGVFGNMAFTFTDVNNSRINDNGGGIVINEYGYPTGNDEDGNLFTITEAGDFTSEQLTEAMTVAFPTYSGIDPDKVYKLTTATRGEWIVSSDGTKLTTTVQTDKSENADDQLFAFIRIDNRYYIYSVNQQKFLKRDGENGVWFAGKGDPFFFNETSTGVYQVFTSGTEQFINSNGSSAIVINGYGTPDGGNSFTFEEQTHASVKDEATTIFNREVINVTYIIEYNGAEVGRVENVEAVTGETAVLPLSSVNGLFTYSYSPATITKGTTEYTVTAIWNGPFEISTDVASAHWYNMTIRDDAKYVDVNTVYSNPNVRIAAQNYSYNQQWAFFGNPYTGLTIRNRANTSWVLNYQTGTYAGVSVNDGTATWIPQPSSNRTNGFYLANSNGSGRPNEQGGVLKYWGGADVGSTFVVSEPNSLDDYSALVTSNIAPWIGTQGQTWGVNDITLGGLWNDSYSTTCTNGDIYGQMYAYIYGQENLITPTDGGYYRIYNETNGRWKNGKGYVGVKADGTLSANIIANGAADDDIKVNPEWASTVIRVNKVDGGYTFAIDGKYIQSPNGANELVQLGDAAVTFVAKLQSPGVVRLYVGNNDHDHTLHRGNIQTKDIIGYNEAGPSDFKFENATSINIALNDGGDNYTYATLYVPFGVTLPADGGVDAYVISTKSSNHATTVNIGKNIPAATPVILRGTATSVTATINDAATADISSSNILSGTYLPKTLGENDVVLGNSATTGIGFYKSSAVLGANKAYLDLSGLSVKSFVLDFDDDATCIEKTLSDSPLKGENIYNLAGQRIQKMQKGLYIVNGKKVLVK